MKSWPFWIAGTLSAAGVLHLGTVLALAQIAGGN